MYVQVEIQKSDATTVIRSITHFDIRDGVLLLYGEISVFTGSRFAGLANGLIEAIPAGEWRHARIVNDEYTTESV